MAALTVLNVPLTLVPSVVTIVMQATRISASITAYSTAVGPSSLAMKRRIALIVTSVWNVNGEMCPHSTVGCATGCAKPRFKVESFVGDTPVLLASPDRHVEGFLC